MLPGFGSSKCFHRHLVSAGHKSRAQGVQLCSFRNAEGIKGLGYSLWAVEPAWEKLPVRALEDMQTAVPQGVWFFACLAKGHAV